MKKFISIVTALTLIFSISSCREVEEVTSLPETESIYTKTNKGAAEVNKESDSTTQSNAPDTDDPKKDKIKW